MKRPPFWIALVLIAAVATWAALRAFPEAFSIISLDIAMDRSHALDSARATAARDHLGPADARQAASFTLDDQTQTFVELEGGGKDAFNAMLRDGVYSAYTWRVRQFREGEANEVTISFRPDGQPYAFGERIKEDAPGAALDAGRAREIAERDAAARWSVDFGKYALVEQGQERRTSGRVDHTFTYERATPTLGSGRYRVRLVVSGDKLTAVSPFVKVPEAFDRRYAEMRAANDAIGQGSVIAMLVLYGAGGIGIGLFLMMRARYFLCRRAFLWGAIIAGLQTLATVNEWPLMWMSYDTAVPMTVFFSQQITGLVGSFLLFTAAYSLSFMAAETLSRRAFGSHPQLWHVWAPRPGSSTSILGRTVAGYLLVALFFAYDVFLYLLTTKHLGWWSPSEALFHPDVLATYVPWFSAFANSLQAGFWEECLFRAVPIAGAALIGDRFGNRRLFIVIAFVVQAIVFGSGHAPYPNQPSYARPVELILPSIGFGLLYLRFGLLPGIILHFTFDTVWFALPLFVAHGQGVWIQRVMVVLVTLVPLWIVLARRVQVGRWTQLEESDLNRGWQPPPAPPIEEPAPATESAPARTMSVGSKTAWLIAGGIGAACALGLGVLHRNSTAFTVTRAEAIDIATRALEARGATLPPGARFMAVPNDGAAITHRFVAETAGEDRRRALVGTYLPKPRWMVRVATFEGDVALRAEEWTIFVTDSREAWPIQHELPEAKPGASLDESAARALALGILNQRWHFDAARGDVQEISAKPRKEAARTDWIFTFVDKTVAPLPQGEPRIDVTIAGNEITSVGRYIHVPESWTRDDEARSSRDSIVQGLAGVVPAGVLLTAAGLAVVAWSRRRYSPNVFFAVAGLLIVVIGGAFANTWPSLEASLSTAQPFGLQTAGIIGIGLVAAGISAVFVSLAFGSLPVKIAHLRTRLSESDARWLGAAAGGAAAGIVALAAWWRTPTWAHTVDVDPLGTAVPTVGMLVAGVPSIFSQSVVIISTLTGLHGPGERWGLGRLLHVALVFLIGFSAGGAIDGGSLVSWFLASSLVGVTLVVLSIGLLLFDVSMVPIAIGTFAALSQLTQMTSSAFPNAWLGHLGSAVVILAVSWWCFRLLRKES